MIERGLVPMESERIRRLRTRYIGRIRQSRAENKIIPFTNETWI